MPDLSSNNRRQLLSAARVSIQNHFKGIPPEPAPPGGELMQPAACFVTLRKKEALRGCVGTFDASHPLYENVCRMARAAAFQDMRFSPVTARELPDLRIEISVLSPPRKIQGMDEIEIGRHGILIRLGGRSGTLLPEVAVEQGWTREQFVMVCAREKAGLTPEECARAELFVYESSKFSEDDGPVQDASGFIAAL